VNNQNVKLTEDVKCVGVKFINCVITIRVGAEISGCTFDNCVINGYQPFIESLKSNNDFKSCT